MACYVSEPAEGRQFCAAAGRGSNQKQLRLYGLVSDQHHTAQDLRSRPVPLALQGMDGVVRRNATETEHGWAY